MAKYYWSKYFDIIEQRVKRRIEKDENRIRLIRGVNPHDPAINILNKRVIASQKHLQATIVIRQEYERR